MKTFKLEKLVRDNVIEGMQGNGDKPTFRILNEEEFKTALKKKLIEETAEITSASDDELLKELADIQEIIDTLLTTYNLSREDLARIQDQKNQKAGGFQKRIYVETVQLSDNSPMLDYYLSQPDKFVEITK